MAGVIETAFGVVMRTRPLTESSLIVHWLTRDLGRLATVAKGARRAKSPLRGKLDLFYAADFSFSRSRRSELHTLREVNLRETHSGLREDLGQLQQACYCANLVEQATEMETPMPGVFELMTGLLAHLTTEGGVKSIKLQTSSLSPESVRGPEAPSSKPQTIFAFELKLLTDLGLKPDLEESRLNPGTKQIVKALTESDWPMMARLKLSEAQIKEVDQFLNGFLVYHLGRVPKGRNAAARGTM